MAETQVAPQAAEAAGGGRKKLLLIGVPVLLLVLGAAAWFLFLAPGDEGEDMAEPDTPMMATDPGPIVQVDEATVSLGGEEPHFAQIRYSAVLSMDADQALVEAEFPRLRSRAQLVFRTYEADVLDTPEGFQQLERDLTQVAAELWPDGEVLEILVESLLVQ